MIVFISIVSMVFLSLLAQSPTSSDEAYVILHTVKNLDFSTFFMGRTGEANNAPLYFVMMKIISLFDPRDDFPYRFWVAIIPSTIFINLAASEVRGKAKLALPFILLGTYAMLLYGANARPYALWMLATWLLTKYTIEKNEVKFVLSAYFAALITPFAFYQIAIAIIFCTTSRTIKLILPAMLYSAFLVFKIEPFPFAWPGFFRFIVLGGHHFTWWICMPMIFLLVKTRKYIDYLAAQFALFLIIVFSFYMHTPERVKTTMPGPGFMITERYFVFLLPTTLYLLLRLWNEYVENRKKFDTLSS